MGVARFFQPPVFEDPEKTRKARLLHGLLGTMSAVGLVSFTLAIVDERNDLWVALTFWGSVIACLFLVATAVHKGHVTLSAWILSIFYWSLIALVTLYFGGLGRENAAGFAACVLLIGVTIGGRAAILMAMASSLWCALVAYLEVHRLLPPPLGPYTPINAWSSIMVTVTLTAILLHAALSSLRRAHELAQKSSDQRDEALRRSVQGQKMELVGNLASGVAHDLNNLLTVIVNAAEVLREQAAAEDQETNSVLDDLEESTSRAALMTTQLLTFGRTQASKLEPVDFSAAFAALGRMLPRLLGSSIEVRLSCEPDLWVRATRTGFEQILLNLAVNARDAMPKGGILELTLRHTEAGVELVAKDTGIGMPEEVRLRVFEPFYTTKASGTGLGLSTVKQLVDTFGGSVVLESAPDRGTTFRVRFPLLYGPEPALEAPGSLRAAPFVVDQHRRILLVEDEPLIRRALVRSLTLEGYDVTAVADGEEALSVVPTIDHLLCIVTDLSMPRMDGETLARLVRERFPSMPLVLLSGNRAPPAELDLGPHGIFLTKPTTGHALAEAIARVTAHELLPGAVPENVAPV